MLVLMLVFTASGLLCAGLAVPLLRGKVPPNHLYGFRVKATLSHPEVWYPANRASARYLLAYGIACVVAALGGWFLHREGMLDGNDYLVLNLAVVVGGVLLVVAFSFRALGRLLAEGPEPPAEE
ncbi:MAG: SdpI family protein [Planctomycetota bacterium]|jgi:hypothetical protein